ncbi:NERD domain-containing protein, partial [Escherichia coli]
MGKVDFKQIVNDFGPCVSSELAAQVRLFHPTMSPEAIRKMISRNEDIAKLPYIRFSHNRRFIYAKKEFGSFRFWDALRRCLLENNSVYSHAILSVINHGDYVRKRDFGIVCGSPLMQSKHLSYTSILDNLVRSRLFRIINVESVGECVVINNNACNDESIKDLAKSESFFEGPIIELIKSWVRNIGLASYNQVKTKYDDENNPIIGSFEWGMTAPSYAYPLAEYTDGKVSPGFIACDFHFDFERKMVNDSTADTFIRKVELTKFSRKNSRIMFVFF